jgi:hypothetical protein
MESYERSFVQPEKEGRTNSIRAAIPAVNKRRGHFLSAT